MDAQVLGERIRIARERLGLSQSQLAKLVSRDQRAISEYEHGERRIWVSDLPALADALEVPLLYFFEGDITPQDLEIQMIMEFRKLLNREAQEDALRLLRLFGEALNHQKR